MYITTITLSTWDIMSTEEQWALREYLTSLGYATVNIEQKELQ